MRVAAIACALGLLMANAMAFGQTVSDPNLQVATVLGSAAGLNQPTGIRFLGSAPDDFFVIEKATGQVKHFVGGFATTALDLPVSSQGERGLLGIALHPDFGMVGQPNADKVYLYYSRSSTSSDVSSGSFLENRLSAFSWNGTTLSNEQVLAVFGNSNDGLHVAASHNGGPIKFGPDRALYGVVGDFQRREAEQNQKGEATTSAHTGGIFRVFPTGAIPAGNPFVSNANSDFHRWYAYGLRNSFGLDFDPATGALWDTENGPTAYDEINRVARGFNSGWTKIMGPDSRSSGSVSDLVKLNGHNTYSDPEFSFRDPVAVTAINFLYGSELGTAYDNRVLVGDANHGNLYMFKLNADRTGFVLGGRLSDLVADDNSQFATVRLGSGFGIVTDIERGPDGKTYVVNLTDGEVYRIEAAAGLVAGVPEPGSLMLAVIGCSAMIFYRRRLSITSHPVILKAARA